MDQRVSFAAAAPAATIGKSRMVDELGEKALLLPEYVNRALAANERAKYGLTLFQTARTAADHPGTGVSRLRAEREALGVTDAVFDEVVPGARALGDDRYLLPHAARVHALVVDAVEEMLTAVRIGALAGAADGPVEAWRARVDALVAAAPSLADGIVPGAYVDAMTQADRAAGDGLHLVVMDLHKALNGLQARIAQESIDGARVYAVRDGDRPLIKAFMTGLNRTAPLKFEHPGLGTTATRAGDRLVLQNDIGTTDSHVFVVHVEGLEAVLTYTDLHAQRARFFQTLLEPWPVDWEDTRSRHVEGLSDDTYYLCVGRFRAPGEAVLAEYLEHVGSRIVFLIDWNRARKRLGNFVGKRDAIAILKWAADHDHGHRAFLQLGGEQLVHEAIEHAHTPIHYGQRLDEVLGREATVDYLKFVLRASCDGLLQGRSDRLVRDELKAELLSYFTTAEQGLLALVSDHAGTIAEIAGAVRDGLLHARAAAAGEFVLRTAERARRLERRADEIVERIRAQVRRSMDSDVYLHIIEAADDSADDLEEAAFLLTLLTAGMRPIEDGGLHDLARLLLEAAREFVKCVEAAAHVHRGSAREDVQDFLEAVDRIITVEDEVDERKRRIIAAAFAPGVADLRQAHLVSQVARSLETSADALGRAAAILRDHVLGDVMVGR